MEVSTVRPVSKQPRSQHIRVASRTFTNLASTAQGKIRWPEMFTARKMSSNYSARYQPFDKTAEERSPPARLSHQQPLLKQQRASRACSLLQKEAVPPKCEGITSVAVKQAAQPAPARKGTQNVKQGYGNKENNHQASRAKLRLKYRKIELDEDEKQKEEDTQKVNKRREFQQVNCEFLEKARSFNSNHLKKLFEQSKDQFHKLLEADSNGEDALRWKLDQIEPRNQLEDSFVFKYYNEFTAKIEEKQQIIDQVLKRRIPRKPSTLTSCVLDVDECKQVIEWYKGTDRTLLSAQQIDKVLNKLNHFRMLSKKVRLQTYAISDVVSFNAGDAIIDCGTSAQFLYVILKGSVSKLTQENLGGLKKHLSNSLFDGELFGYLDNFTGEGLYSYAVIAEEDCLMLRLPYRQYVNIQSEFLSNELSTKLTFLNRLQCFSHVVPRDLIPLATLLKERRVANGEYIVREGQSVKQFMILTKGTAVVTKSTIVTRKKEIRKNYFAKTGFRPWSSGKQSFHQPPEYGCTVPFHDPMENKDKVRCNYQLLSEDNHHYTYFYLSDFRQLMAGDCIAYRAVNLSHGNHSAPEKFRLSILSSSNDCSLLVLRTEEVCKIPDYLLHPLVRFCEGQRDFDEVSNQAIRKELHQQEQFKVKLLKEISDDFKNKRKFSYRSL